MSGVLRNLKITWSTTQMFSMQTFCLEGRLEIGAGFLTVFFFKPARVALVVSAVGVPSEVVGMTA